MKHADFETGHEFICAGQTYRCTDVGRRTIVAISLDGVEKRTKGPDGTSTITMDRTDAERDGWFNGPPYGVPEIVFDEDDFEACEPVAS